MTKYRPEVVFHAAALKHVPIVEKNWSSAIKTNVFGTQVAAKAALESGVRDFVLISTDKAVEPNNILGLTKRTAEQICSAMNAGAESASKTQFTSVRFGNVFGSEGSVATIFEEQIERGGPVTITDPRMTRYFMTMDEAIELVILSAATARTEALHNFHLFMIDMGDPIAITELANAMINLAGYTPGKDIQIVYTGVRAGEKLDEKLIASDETKIEAGSDLIHAVASSVPSRHGVDNVLHRLETAIAANDVDHATAVMRDFWMIERSGGKVLRYPGRSAS
jgi:O-antigen biosynthesis protein WbqV